MGLQTVEDKRRGLQSRRRLASAAAAVVLAVAMAGPAVAPASAQTENETLSERTFGGSIVEGVPAVLEADSVAYDSELEVVRASGDVQVFYQDRVLRADEIIYDARNDSITATGDVRVINPDGSVIVADNAAFDSELRDGLIRGARAVLSDGQGRFASVEGRRVDGRYTTLSKAVFSPCEVCEDSPTPLWRIRARKIVHDEVAKDIMYEDATFEVFGVPVAYLPYFRHADPTVRRRTGFLTPSLVSNSSLGDYVKVPFFWAIDPHRDLTVTPWIGSGDAVAAGEIEYRAIETYGSYEIRASAAWSEEEPNDGFRGHVDSFGNFALGQGFQLTFDVVAASDDTYLRRYEFRGGDRVEQRAAITRFGKMGFSSIETIRYQSFRSDEPAGQIPLVAPHVELEQSLQAPWIGGEFTFTGDALYLRRNGVEGRDTARLSGSAGWSDQYVSSMGLILDAEGVVRGDVYNTNDDDAFGNGFEGRILPHAAATARYPLGRATSGGFHVIEPVAQVVVAPYGGNQDSIPNEDSQNVELDELSIFAINRFAGLDRWEDGPRAVLGMRYERIGLTGVDLTAELGQSYRLRENQKFSSASGFRDVTSDIVGAWTFSFNDRVNLGHRFRLSDEAFGFERNEFEARLKPIDRFRLTGGYVALDADSEGGGASADRQEARGTAAFDLTEYWTLSGDVRHDLERSRFVDAGGVLAFENECCSLLFRVDRRFNDVEDAPDSTTYGFQVRLKTTDLE